MSHAKILSEEDFLLGFDTHADEIFRHCYLRVGDRESSKALTSQAYQRLWAFITQGNYVDSMQLFLYREINALIERRPESRLIPVELPVEVHQWSPERRTLFILQYVDRFSSKQISTILGGTAHENSLTNQEMTSLSPALAHA